MCIKGSKWKHLIFPVFLLACLLTSIPSTVHAQSGGPDDPDPDAVPLDPGSWILVVAGVGYGVKKWKENKQKNKTDITESENEITK